MMKLIQNSPSPQLFSSKIWFECSVKASLSCCHNTAAHRRTWCHGKVPAARQKSSYCVSTKTFRRVPLSPLSWAQWTSRAVDGFWTLCTAASGQWICPVLVLQLLLPCLWKLGFLDDLWDGSARVATLPALQGQVVASVVALPLRCFHMASLGHFWSVQWIPYLQINNWDGIFPTGCEHCSLCVGVLHLHHKTHGDSWTPFKPANRPGRWWWSRSQGWLQVTASFWG